MPAANSLEGSSQRWSALTTMVITFSSPKDRGDFLFQSGRNFMAKKIGGWNPNNWTKSGNDFFPLSAVAWKQLQKPPSLQSTARAKHAPIGHGSVFGAMAHFLCSEILKASPPKKKGRCFFACWFHKIRNLNKVPSHVFFVSGEEWIRINTFQMYMK